MGCVDWGESQAKRGWMDVGVLGDRGLSVVEVFGGWDVSWFVLLYLKVVEEKVPCRPRDCS